MKVPGGRDRCAVHRAGGVREGDGRAALCVAGWSIFHFPSPTVVAATRRSISSPVNFTLVADGARVNKCNALAGAEKGPSAEGRGPPPHAPPGAPPPPPPPRPAPPPPAAHLRPARPAQRDQPRPRDDLRGPPRMARRA